MIKESGVRIFVIWAFELPSSFVISLGNPLAAVGNKDWQFFHHELGLANGAIMGTPMAACHFFDISSPVWQPQLFVARRAKI